MKNPIFVPMVVLALLAVAATGCTSVRSATDDGYYEEPVVTTAPSRIYVDDPYRPGASILMERDPFTGRYYPVGGGAAYTPYGSYGTPPPPRGYRPPRNHSPYNSLPPRPQPQPAPAPAPTQVPPPMAAPVRPPRTAPPPISPETVPAPRDRGDLPIRGRNVPAKMPTRL